MKRIILAASLICFILLIWALKPKPGTTEIQVLQQPVRVQEAGSAGGKQAPVAFTAETTDMPAPAKPNQAVEEKIAEPVAVTDDEVLLPFQENGRWGFKNRKGLILAAIFEEAYAFSEGVADVKLNGKYGFIDSSGNFVVNPQFDSAWGFQDGVAMVHTQDKYGYIDHTGNFIADPNLDVTWGFSEGLSAVSIGGKFGFIDKTGAYRVSPQFDYAWPFEGGHALVKTGERLWYIDRNGNFVRDFQ